MIGPGWMPSRPRPLKQQVRRLVSYAPSLRRNRRAAGPGTASAVTPELGPDDAPRGLFADRKAKLPVATLLPRRTDGRPAVITGALHRWVAHRWMWVKPRAIPLFVAFMGLLGVLDARHYLLQLARGPVPIEEQAGVATVPDVPAMLHETRIH
jgi:hypothetical protein